MIKYMMIAVYLVFGISGCESVKLDEPDGTSVEQVQRTDVKGRDASEDGDILDDMLDYVIEKNNVAEGRKKEQKKKKLMKYIALAMLIKALLLPKIIGFVKFLTAKAYALSILALVTAALITSMNDEHHDTEEVINLLPKERDKGPQTLSYNYWWKRRQDEPLRS